eukprot:SM000003S11215  [mRNA]  locus=s3:1611199:1615417:+ [translate_table: standard]
MVEEALATVTDEIARSSAVERLLHSAGHLGARISGLATAAVADTVQSVDDIEEAGWRLDREVVRAARPVYQALANQEPVAVAAAVAVGSGLLAVAAMQSKRRLARQKLPLRYNYEQIAAYFRSRPWEVFFRSAKILLDCSVLTSSILIDRWQGVEARNEPLRARQLVQLITRLGPTAIKLGQALSIRPDLLSPTYLEALQTLQDRVQAFSSDEARRLMEEELGCPLEDVFLNISLEPVAAASLGQVYKAKLVQNGETVAVKVQRPGVLEGIARDLYVLRIAADWLRYLPNNHSDLVAVLDNWALRFFDELDYVQEGKNQMRFIEDMKSLANITVPTVYPNLTTRRVLTTGWVEGEKLSESKAEDLTQLVTTALNCYLIQLLESGFLHADPHPGNLLRTPEGKLCVLDFGLMTEVTEDQRYALITYISHLVNSDFARVAEDLVILGFVPPELVDPNKTAAVVPALSKVLGQLIQGGGAKNVNIAQISDDLAKMAGEYVFVIPPYFALILRAFGVLEGIGLDNDPNYAIVNECYPYMSKRLLTDDNPKAREALRYFLYGPNNQLDVKRVESLAAGFQTFRQLMTPVAPSPASPTLSKNIDRAYRPAKALPPSRKSLDPTAQQALLLVFAPEGSYLQELLLTELVRAVDALSREAMAELWSYFASRSIIPLSTLPGSWPVPLPGMMFGMARGTWPVARLSDDDQRALGIVRSIWNLLEPHLNQSGGTQGGVGSIAGEMFPLLRDILPGATTFAQRFALMLLQRQALRFADDLDGRRSVAEWEKDPAASARLIKPSPLLRRGRPERRPVGSQRLLPANYQKP